ncbi:MAG: peptidoglycan DD-metalloendopeptidase family protein [Nitrospiraceae bacterium]|nr:MAG: peptidoglycan DD-metalloendopeptidase family protein [Nitrospiraceae bacterium]
MKHTLFGIIALSAIITILSGFRFMSSPSAVEELKPVQEKNYTITGIVKSKDTMSSIFDKHNLKKDDLSLIYRSAKKKHNLSKLAVGNIYSFTLDRLENNIQSMQYGIDDSSYLQVTKIIDGFNADKVDIIPDIRTGELFIDIKDNLILSMPGSHKEYLKLALELSDIYAWDIDFSSDIRSGDSLKIIVEELWIGEAFKGYGDILAVEFVNNGRSHNAYRFAQNDYVDYYDSAGKSLRKSLLRSPLKFKYISSRFSKRRLHPKLRIYRPHLAVDYAASRGTPVSAAGNGSIAFAGYKGQNGKMIKIKHNGGYMTYYGHLSKFAKGIKKGRKVSQGDIIGYVGSTGLATGPHLDYRIKRYGQFVNPLTIKLPRGKSVPKDLMAEFLSTVNKYQTRFASMHRPVIALQGKRKPSG